MWAQNAKYNNHYLQLQLQHMKPKEINEMVNKDVKKHKTDNTLGDSANKHFKPPCKRANYFEQRSELAYGIYALPKLMKELASDDYTKAIVSLAEYIRNPLNAQRAIKRYDIIRRCQNVFLRIRYNFQKCQYREMGYLLDIIYQISMHMNGAHEIVNKFRQLTEFYIIIRYRQDHMDKVAKILAFLSEEPTRALNLIEDYRVYDEIEIILKRDICVPYYPEDFWQHLTHIFQVAPQKAVNCGIFEILHTRIKGRLFQYHRWDMKCFGLLLHCPEAQKRFVDIDGIKELYGILTDEDHKLDSYENVIFTLMNGLLTKALLWRCREFTDLPLLIMKLSKEKENHNQQLLCFQTLRQMGEMPCIKRFIKENCLEDLKNVECTILENEKERNEIVYWLEREKFHTTDL